MQAHGMPNGGLGPYHQGPGQEYPMNPSPSYQTHPLPGQMPPPQQHQGPPPPPFQQGQPQFAQHGAPYYNPAQSAYYPPNFDQGYYPNTGAYPGQGYYPPGPSYNPAGYQQYMPGQPHSQMGGPGPATVQNAYPGYQGDGYARQHIGGQQGLPQPGPQSNGHDGMDHSHFGAPPPPGDGHYSHPQQPPLPSQYHQPDGSYPGPYPSHPPPQQQPYFPPGHPYAYGGGTGYQQQHQQQQQIPYPYNNGYPSTLNPSASAPPQTRQPSKGLNPAAQGFTFRPSSRTRQHPSPAHAPNGDVHPAPTVNQAPSDDTPTYPSLEPSQPQPASQAAPSNDQSDAPVKPTEWTLPIVNSTHVNGNTNGPSTESGLGLSQMDPAPTAAANESVPMAPEASTSKSTQGTSNGSISPPMVKIETPQIGNAENKPASPPTVKPVAEEKEEEKLADALSFTGPTVEGYVSPEKTQQDLPATPASNAATAAASPVDDTVQEKFVINVAARRPAPDQLDGIAFAPAAVKPDNGLYLYNELDVKSLPSSSRICQRSRPRKGKALVRMGHGSDTRMHIADRNWVFGELGVEDIPAIVILTPAKPVEAAPSEAKEEEDKQEATVAAPAATAAAPAPKAKPTSWAALLRKPELHPAPIDSLSAGPSSIRVSPSKSNISLATETDAMTSDPTTPRSTATQLPPATTNGPRPAFHYAAAASAGKNTKPENDLVKLLTEGPKPRAKNAPVQATVPRGLINTGNLCFANTILQVLVYCIPFSDLLHEFGNRLPADLSHRTPLIEALILFLHEFQPSSSAASSPAKKQIALPNGNAKGKGKGKEKQRYTANNPFIPENVYDAMKQSKRFDSMRRGHQEDAEEFLGFFIETLHEENLDLVSRSESTRSASATRPQANGDATEIRRPVSPVDGWLEVGKKQKTNVVRSTEARESAISRLFGGTLRSVLHTPGQKDSVTIEPYQSLQLDIQSPSVKSITDAFRQLNEPEIVPGVFSASRNTHVDATKQVFIETFPPVLILHLKRFVYDGKQGDVVKKNKPIAYASELVIPSEAISAARRSPAGIKYRLCGVIYHHGSSASGGHYTNSVSRQDGKGWIHFDDETHSTVAEEDVMVSPEEAEAGKFGLIGGREKCAYILFYEKVR